MIFPSALWDSSELSWFFYIISNKENSQYESWDSSSLVEVGGGWLCFIVTLITGVGEVSLNEKYKPSHGYVSFYTL